MAVLLGIVAIAFTHDDGPQRFSLEPVGFGRLSEWTQDHLAAAVPVFLKSCKRFLTRADAAPLDAVATSVDFGRVGDWRPLCEAAEALPPGDDAAAREFFEKAFIPFAVADYGKAGGLFTGYYEIELNGSRQRHGRFQTPLYRKPADLGPKPPARADIEDGTLAGQGLELLWVDDPIDAFFLQIQGSGRVRLNEGGTVRACGSAMTGRTAVPTYRSGAC